ncbi:MAG: alpha/beta fold hydrolase [Pseudanabaenaceae cyanobacterium]
MSFLLFAQHGWADNNRGMHYCGKLLGVPASHIIAPDLGWWQTWWRLEPLVAKVRRAVEQQLKCYPNLPWRIVGHSMGGLIWLELLYRYPQWHDRVESLVLLGSPVGGAELSRMFDPFQLGIGIAKDLSTNRRAIAEVIAQKIPTLSIAGDLGDGSDGIVTIGATQFKYCQWQCLPNIFHPNLRTDVNVIQAIKSFWQHLQITPPPHNLQQQLLDYFRAVESIVEGSYRDFSKARIVYRSGEGLTVRLWQNPLGILHVFLGDGEGQCYFAGYTGWLHRGELEKAIAALPERFGDMVAVE